MNGLTIDDEQDTSVEQVVVIPSVTSRLYLLWDPNFRDLFKLTDTSRPTDTLRPTDTSQPVDTSGPTDLPKPTNFFLPEDLDFVLFSKLFVVKSGE